MKSTVDVIIPVYNTPSRLLEQCFLSVQNQSYGHVRIIIIDDGSSHKDTVSTIEKYRYNKNISIFKQKNSGVSTARNLGLKKSKSDFILFLDSDDYIDSTYIERLLKIAINKHKKIVFSGKIKTPNMTNDAPFKERALSMHKDRETITLKLQAFTSQGVIIDGELARSVRFEPEAKMGEDTEYILRVMALASGDIYFEGNGGYYYVKHSENATQSNTEEDIREFLRYSIILARRIDEILKPTADTTNLYKLLKFSRASKKAIRAKMDYSSFKTLYNEYASNAEISKIRLSTIFNNNLLSHSEKARIGLLAKRRIFTLYALNKVLAK